MLPAETVGAAAQHVARCARRTWDGAHADRLLDLGGDGVDLGVIEVGDVVVGRPSLQHLLGRAAIQAAVDLGTATGAAPLGVGDRWQAEGDGHPAGTVLAVHLRE